MKKFLLILVIIALFAFTFAGCGPKDNSNKEDFLSLYECKTEVINSAIVKKINYKDCNDYEGEVTFNQDYAMLVVILKVTQPSDKLKPVKINSTDLSFLSNDEKTNEGGFFKSPCFGFCISKNQKNIDNIVFVINDKENLYLPIGTSYKKSKVFYLAIVFDYDYYNGEPDTGQVWISSPSNLNVDVNNFGPNEEKTI